jgi:hypothetical protein
MPAISTILLGFALPVLLTAAGIAAAWRAWERDHKSDGRWIGAPLLGAALAIAFWNLRARPHLPGQGDVIEWVFWFAIFLGILGWLDALLRLPFWMRAVIVVFVWRLVIRLVLQPLIPSTLALAEEWIDFLSLAALGWWWTMESVAGNSPGLTVPLILVILSLGSAVLLTSWHIVGSATVAASAAAICCAAAAVAGWRGHISLERGAAPAIALPLLALLVHGFFYTSDTLTMTQQILALVLLISPMLALIGDLPPFKNLRPTWRLVVRLLPVILAVGIAAGWSLHQYTQSDQSQQQDE